MSFVAVAIGGSAVIGAGSSLIAGNKAAKAQKNAANQNAALQEQQNEEARRQYDLARGDNAPYRDVGTGALYKLSDLMGIQRQPGGSGTDWNAYLQANPDVLQSWQTGTFDKSPYSTPEEYAQAHYNLYGKAEGRPLGTQTSGAPSNEFGALDRSFTLADFEKDPGYEFRRAEGQRGLESSAAARGGILSGGALKAIARYNQEMGSQEYGAAYNRYNSDLTTRFNRLSSLAGTGQTAVNNDAQSGQQLVNNTQAGVNNIMSNNNAAGNARASQYAGTGQAIGNAANQVGQYFALRDLYGPSGAGYGTGTGSGMNLRGTSL